MNKEEFELILQEGETHKIEFKESIEGIDREMVAFANLSGGRIIIGVSDDGAIKGIRVTNKFKSQIQDIANNCEPTIKIRLEEFKSTLIVHVLEGREKPYMCKKGFFIRMGPNSQKLTRNEILKFAIHEGRVRYDEQINPKFNFKEDFDEKGFLSFLKRAGITANLPFENILVNMNLAEKERKKYCFKNLVSLFFSKNIRKFNSSAYTTCILFKGKNRSHIIDRKDFDGNLIEQVEDAVKFVEKNALMTYQIKGLVRKEISQYPIDAVREGIVNAVMHRDYFETGSNVFVYIYDEFIEIVNPGGLFGIKKEQLGKICARRNELIADLFKTVGFVEKAGTGIQRMKDAMRKAGLKEPKIDVSENFFTITFYGHKKRELEEISLGEETLGLNERQKRAIAFVKEKGKITNKDYQKLNKVHRNTATKDLEPLVKLRMLKRKGHGRGSYYEIV
ncbi:MAG: putative DNA binding domain-containing protein [Candidatus Thermoplasmatota archaeon]|nr:putative DNA binding domain-containing protein [Candidatus Thermoplasmatota archaeon]MCG2827333.1 putative DNA binding domain-containing protein [Thermoplasmatales archaeon]